VAFSHLITDKEVMFRKALLTLVLVSVTAFTCDTFPQNLKADGYKGIWFSFDEKFEYGYKFSGGLGTYSPQHRPLAIYSPEAGKTFFVYGGTTSDKERHLQIMVSYFDHRTRTVPKPVIVYDKQGVSEPHDNASMAIDEDGYIWIFVSGRLRTRPGLIFRSHRPYSIESFEQVTTMEMTFPQSWCLNSNLMMVFIRVRLAPELYLAISPDGREWGNVKRLASMGGNFHATGIHGNRLFVVFNFHPEGNLDGRTNLYLIQTDDMGETWKTVDDKVIKTPLTDVQNEALIRDFRKENKRVYLIDLSFDREGNPVILAIISNSFRPGPEGDPREWMVINWKNNRWNFNKVCESTHNYDGGVFYLRDDGWCVIGPTEPGPSKYGTGGEIGLWVSMDEGLTWTKERDVTRNSPVNNSYVRRPVAAHRDFYAFWADGDADKMSRSRLYFTNEKCSKVWVLPYDMKRENQRPVRVR